MADEYEDEGYVEPHKLCDTCKSFVAKLEYLTFPWDEIVQARDKYFPHKLVHYPNKRLLEIGAQSFCHWCCLVKCRTRLIPPHQPAPDITASDQAVYEEGSIIASIKIPSIYHRKSDKRATKSIHSTKFLFLSYFHIIGEKKLEYFSCTMSLCLLDSEVPINDASTRWRWGTSMVSTQACRYIKESISVCKSQHRLCNQSLFCQQASKDTSTEGMPMRLVDTKPEGTEHNLQIVYSSGIGRVDYMTLSYTWGGVYPFMLTDESYAECFHGFDSKSLPKTFRDAVHVTRRLGQRYLWIDALCIKQHDLNEWHNEGSRMGEIYSGSMLTIAASDSPNCNAGFLPPRKPLETQKYRLDVGAGINWYLSRAVCANAELQGGILQGRGWALQERALSPRQIFVGQGVIRWECREEWQCELAYPTNTCSCRSDHKSIKSWIEMGSIEFGNEQDKISAFGRYWKVIAERYAPTNLTNWDDRSMALSGVGKCFQVLSGFKCCFGMWLELMPDCLIWYVDGGAKHQPEVAPSWSWLNLEFKPGKVSPGLMHNPKGREYNSFVIRLYTAQVVRFPEPKSFEEPVSALTGNSKYNIRLRCRASLKKLKVERYGEHSSAPMFVSILDNDPYGRVYLDDRDETLEDGESEWCLILATSERIQQGFHTKRVYDHFFLIVRASTDKSAVFHRIGMAFLYSQSDCSDWAEKEFEIA